MLFVLLVLTMAAYEQASPRRPARTDPCGTCLSPPGMRGRAWYVKPLCSSTAPNLHRMHGVRRVHIMLGMYCTVSACSSHKVS